ncbi:uncharacterized protein LOC108630107, partial [Ceratina calcarata]|uniref:Uncharacterized protein LOC108630107 n=1 Tax=Ceratina calcarata TaxID=156304 RepID=A0AAJ7JAB2_9HYME
MGISYLEGTFESLTGYGNGTVTPVGMLTTSLTIDGVTAKVKIHVISQKYQPIPLIVGHPYTEQDHVEIVSRVNELLIRRVDDSKADEPQKTILWVKEADVSLEGGIREDGQLIPRCVVKADDQGMSMVPVLNISGGELVIDERTILTRGEAVMSNARTVIDIINDFKDLIAKNICQIGCIDRAEMSVTLIDDNPVCYRPYRVSKEEQQQQREIIQGLIDANIIEENESPFSSSRLINTVLGKLRGVMAMAYIDDIIIPSETVADGLSKLQEVFKELISANLTLKLEKCYFLQRKIEYLGFEITAEGIAPGKRKLIRVKEYPMPFDVKK